ncbi:hypothetical protein EJD97_014899 [Solanum chilense]|uniref:Uncharacterized protein n=1 Tax=Solanum chilense TaxID=4083 RepID=A0A6N2BAW1_SOLCI|nr:hypothetical protein EJD97_014899 [Solanum chilense]
MDVQSPSKRFTRVITLHVKNNVEHSSLFLGLTHDFGNISGSMSKSNTMQKIRSKLRIDPTRFVDGGVKDHADVVAGSSKKMKVKIDVYAIHNDKNEAVGFGSFEHHKVYL